MAKGEGGSSEMAKEALSPSEIDQGKLAETVRQEIDDLKATVKSFSVQHIKDGSWFNRFVQSMLGSYADKVVEKGGADYFRKLYPGFSDEAIVDKLSQTAIRYASVAGGASGATASAAFASTIGTAGGASVVALPAAATGILAETFYTTRLQLRLVHDIATIYGLPFDPENLEDVYSIFAVAFGIKAGASAGVAAKQFGPEVARSQIRGLIHGHTAAYQAVAIRLLGPKLGRKVTQRAVLRTAVPVAGVGISAGWNYASTRAVAWAARKRLKIRAQIRKLGGQLAEQLKGEAAAALPVLQALWAISHADEVSHPNEEELFRRFIDVLEPPREILEVLERQLGGTADEVPERLARIETPGAREALGSALALAVAADGEVDPRELELLERFFVALDLEFRPDQVRNMAIEFEPPEGIFTKAAGATAAVGARAAEGAGAAIRQLRKLSRWRPGGESGVEEAKGPGSETSTAVSDEESRLQRARDRLEKLQSLFEEGILTEEELQAKRAVVLDELTAMFRTRRAESVRKKGAGRERFRRNLAGASGEGLFLWTRTYRRTLRRRELLSPGERK